MNSTQSSLGSDGGQGQPRAAAAVIPAADRAWMPFDTNFDSNEVWMRRRRHRIEAIRAVRRSDDHVRVLEIRGHGQCAYLHMPIEPNPYARVSKRAWERSVQKWRRDLASICDSAQYYDGQRAARRFNLR